MLGCVENNIFIVVIISDPFETYVNVNVIFDNRARSWKV